MVANAKTTKQDDTMVEFRVIMMSTCTHKGPTFHYKAQTDMCLLWEQYQVPTAKLEHCISTISPVMDLHGWNKALWKSRPIDISGGSALAQLFNTAISWANNPWLVFAQMVTIKLI